MTFQCLLFVCSTYTLAADSCKSTAANLRIKKPPLFSKMEVVTEAQLLTGLRKTRSSVPCIALDIDETLSWTGSYPFCNMENISERCGVYSGGYWMQEMQKLFGNPEGLSVEEMFGRYKLCQNVPYWQNNPAAKQWMSERRACPETQRDLPVIDKAVECVAALEAQCGIKVICAPTAPRFIFPCSSRLRSV